jgi:site-specific DNA-methyltransferase (adenine-specific)
VPKRPPRVARELPVPADLRGEGPVRAAAVQGGELWRADVFELLGRLADRSVDLVVTDPPYAIAKEAWDEFESLEVYVAWCDRWLAEVARVLAPHGSAYVCGFSEILADVKARSARRFASCRWLVWYYRNKANLGRDWGRSHESILHLRQADARVDVDAIRIPYNGHTTRYPARIQAVSSQYSHGQRRDRWVPNPLGAKPRDVIEIPVICNGMAEKTPHATQKPEALIERLIRASSAPGQLVVDPFVGSGTTAVVAARLGRLADVYRFDQSVFFNTAEGRPANPVRWGIRMYWVVALLALAGIVLLARRGRPEEVPRPRSHGEARPRADRFGLVVLLAPIVMVICVAIVTYGGTRFRYAAEPSLVILAAVTLVAGAELLLRSSRTARAASPPASAPRA